MMALRYILLFFVAWVSSCKPVASGPDGQGTGKARVLSVKDFLEAYRKEPAGEAMLIDLRTPPEFNDGFVPGAVMINFLEDDIDLQLGGLDKSKTYYLYCQEQSRSTRCQRKMEDMGFNRVYIMQGGYEAYLHSGSK